MPRNVSERKPPAIQEVRCYILGCGRPTPRLTPHSRSSSQEHPEQLRAEPRDPPSPQTRGRYLQEAAHLGAQGRELLGRRLGIELPAEQLGRQGRVAVVGGLRDAAEQSAQRLAALRSCSRCLLLLLLLLLVGHFGGAAPAPRPAPLRALGWRLAAGARPRGGPRCWPGLCTFLTG